MKSTLTSLAMTLLALLSGCNTVPVSYQEAKLIPQNRILPALQKYQAPCQDCAHVVIVRDGGSLGSMWACHIFYEGEELASLRPGEKLQFYLPLGEQIIGYFMGPGANGAPIENSFYFREAKNYYFRVSVSAQGTLLTPTSLVK